MDRQIGDGIRRSQPERLVWTVAGVMLRLDLEHLLQVATPDDQQPVQAFSSDRANPPLGVGVRVGRLDRRPGDLDTLGAEPVVEWAAELRVAVVEQEAQLLPLFAEHQQQGSGLLGDPGTVRVGGHAEHWLIAASRARSVGASPGSWELAAQHGELVAEDEDLQLLGGVAAGQQGQGSWMEWRSIR